MAGNKEGRVTPFSTWLKGKLADKKIATELEVIALRDALIAELKSLTPKQLADLNVKAAKLDEAIWKSGLKKTIAAKFGVECTGLGRGRKPGAAVKAAAPKKAAAKEAAAPAPAKKRGRKPSAAKAAAKEAAAPAPAKKRGRKPGVAKAAAKEAAAPAPAKKRGRKPGVAKAAAAPAPAKKRGRKPGVAKAAAAPAPAKKRGRKPGAAVKAAAPVSAGMSFDALLSALKGVPEHPLFAAWVKDVFKPFAAKSAEAAAVMGTNLEALLKKALEKAK